MVAGHANLLLFVFNMLPAPPLDGSHILANFSRPFARFLQDPKNHGAHMLMFFASWGLTFAIMPRLLQVATRVAGWVVTVGL